MNDPVIQYPTEITDSLMLREETSQPDGRRYDLAERTARHGEQIISFARSIPEDTITKPLLNQLIRSGTAIGANYGEADDAISKREFRQKIGFCRKEARETKYWLRMLAHAAPACKEAARPLWQEAKELHLIFCAIARNSQDPEPKRSK